MPSECPEAKRWAPSSWQREKQLAQEKSQGLDLLALCAQTVCPGHSSWLASCDGQPRESPSHCPVLPPELVELDIDL